MRSTLICVAVVTAAAVLIMFMVLQREASIHRALVTHEIASLLASRVVLEELRLGHFSNAVELLESSVDSSVLQITHGGYRVNESTRGQIEASLHIIAGYRSRYPRTIEADFYEGYAEESIHRAEKVRSILFRKE
jgi:hypothetical protein